MSRPTPVIAPALVYTMLYGAGAGRRFTQDSPMLPEVWLALAHDPHAQVSTLSVPRKDLEAHELARDLYARLKLFRSVEGQEREPSNVSDIPGIVGADLFLDEIVAVVLPMTRWWKTHDLGRLAAEYLSGSANRSGQLVKQISGFFRAIIAHEKARAASVPADRSRPFMRQEWRIRLKEDRRGHAHYVSEGTLRLLALLIMIWLAGEGDFRHRDGDRQGNASIIEDPADFEEADVERAVSRLLDLATFSIREEVLNKIAGRAGFAEMPRIFSLSLNRRAQGSDIDSVQTTKADAAKRLFNISCADIAWAIIDSGVNARHFAFRRSGPAERVRLAANWDTQADSWCSPIESPRDTRVIARFDLSFVYQLRNRDVMLNDSRRASLAAEIATTCGAADRKRIEDNLQFMADDLERGRTTDWNLVAELVALAFDRPPDIDHGTHVAGILGGAWPEEDDGGKVSWHEGMCPDIKLYDFKVTGHGTEATEFAVIAAMRLIRHLNQRNDYVVIHGANLSLSIPHDVTNYACGRTPVCDEAEKLHRSGVVVVAAAGNDGYNEFQTKRGFKSLHTTTSITDPGNAEEIITVGSTHRSAPHTYGVSYFSSRGPTGDGRMKPDLVAPGEKIRGPVGEDEFAVLEGTSMAAPHVSGAAAMLMSRYPEMVGQPGRIKQVLCHSATDVGRERAFQGHGVLDILRALQAV